jgi:hypothetical protein
VVKARSGKVIGKESWSASVRSYRAVKLAEDAKTSVGFVSLLVHGKDISAVVSVLYEISRVSFAFCFFYSRNELPEVGEYIRGKGLCMRADVACRGFTSNLFITRRFDSCD